MAFYGDEDDIWKCPKHPSKRKKSGICPLCLRDRLVSLCPDCANVRPCNCYAVTSSSSSSSSSFSRLSTDVASIGRLSNLIDSEPAFRRSRSVAIPFLRSRSRFVADNKDATEFSRSGSGKASSFWSLFKSRKSKKNREEEEEEVAEELRRRVMMRSRSVAVSDSNSKYVRTAAKGPGWYFPSPIKVFRQSKISNSKVQERSSPLHRG